MEQTAHAAKQAQKKNQIRRKIANAQKAAIIAGSLPFTPPGLSILAGGIAGIADSHYRAELHKREKPIDFAQEYENVDIDENDILRSTYLGHGIPFVEWRNGLNKLANEHGMVSPDARRKFAKKSFEQYKPIFLNDDLSTRHMALMAGTGQFKTEFIKSLVSQQINKGAGAIIVEAKSDSDFSGSIYKMMEDANRLDDLRIVNFEKPDMSHTYNPFFSGSARTMLSTAMKIQAADGEEFWKDLSRFALSAAILSMKLQPGEPAFHIADIVAMLTDFRLLMETVLNINANESKTHEDGQAFLLNYLRFWYDEERCEFKSSRSKDMLLGLVSKLTAFTHSEYGQIVNTYNPDVDIKEAILQGQVVILSMSALADKEGTELFGRLFIADLARAVGEIQLSKQKPLGMCPAIFDEYGSVAEASQLALFQLARSANVPIVIAMQGRGFLDQQDPTFGDNVLGNCWHHIYGDVRDTATREFAANMSATILSRMTTESEGFATGNSYNSASSGMVTTDSDSFNKSKSFREDRENLVQPNDFADLDMGDAIMIGKSGTYRMRLPIVKINTGKIPSWEEMILVKKRGKGREGVGLWKQLTKINKNLMRNML